MYFHGNQLLWTIKHLFISLSFKYHSLRFICFSTMVAPVISSLDEIYCRSYYISLAGGLKKSSKFWYNEPSNQPTYGHPL